MDVVETRREGEGSGGGAGVGSHLQREAALPPTVDRLQAERQPQLHLLRHALRRPLEMGYRTLSGPRWWRIVPARLLVRRWRRCLGLRAVVLFGLLLGVGGLHQCVRGQVGHALNHVVVQLIGLCEASQELRSFSVRMAAVTGNVAWVMSRW